jgi:uridylate kinase
MNPDPALPYQRVLLKLSGEALAGPAGCGIDPEQAEFIAGKIRPIHALGIQVAVVIGGGNMWRGAQGVARGMDRSTADHMGMIATVMNGLALRDALERVGVETRVQTAIQMNAIAEPYIRLKTISHLQKDRVVILVGGIGDPYFTTDSAAALRAAEIHADIVVKATKVNGVYSDDPMKNPSATRFKHLSYEEVLQQRLEIMDRTAFTICQENHMPILVLDFWHGDDLLHGILGDSHVGTLINDQPAPPTPTDGLG